MIKKVDILPEHLSIVLAVLQASLHSPATVWAFGSRTKHITKKYSDLDLIIDAPQPLSLDVLAKLDSAFEETPLPYKVDIVDWNQISTSFKDRIKKERILIGKIQKNS